MALTKITGNVIEAGAVTSASINTASIATAIANDGLVANSSGIFVNANSGLSSNSSGTFVVGGTGVTSNATGIHIGQDVSTTSDVTFGNVSSSAMSVGSHAITANTTHLLLGSVKLDAVDTAIANLVASAPGTLDTLNEIATALGSDPDLANTLTTSIATKAPIANPSFTGNATFDTTTLFVDGTNDRVGIGTASPNGILSINAGVSSGNNWVNFYNNTGGSNPPDYPGLFVGWNKSNGNGETIIGAGYGSLGASAPRLDFALYNGTTYTTAMTIKSDASVGIGTSSPASALHVNSAGATEVIIDSGGTGFESKLTFTADNQRAQIRGGYQSGGGGYLTFRTDTTGGTDLERMRIDASGNLIMTAGGTIRAGGVNDLILDAGESGTPDIYLQSGGATKVKIEGGNGNVGIGASSALDNKLEVNGGDIRVRGTSTPSIKFNNADQEVVGVRLKSGASGVLSFHTDKMVIDSSGNVGIGTDNPQAKLEVDDSTGGFGARITNNNDASQGLQVRTSDNDTGLYILDLQSSTSATGTNYASRFVVEKSGNVGIGTSSPQAKFHVASSNTDYSALIGRYDSDDGLFLHSDAQSTHYNWLITTQDNVNKGFEIIPSATVGARDFTTPAFVIIADTGHVGIGRTDPLAQLHVASSANVLYQDTLVANTGQSDSMVGMKLTTTHNHNNHVGVWFATGSSDGTHWSGITGNRSDAISNWGTHLSFYTHKTTQANLNEATERVRVEADGTLLHKDGGQIHTLRTQWSQGLGTFTTTDMNEDTNFQFAYGGFEDLGVLALRGFGQYVDIKTNYTADNLMFMFKFTGYLYNRGNSLFYGGGYTYQSSVIAKDVGSGNAITGPCYVYDVYRASDNALCVKIYGATTSYDEGKVHVGLFTFGASPSTRIVAARVTNSTTNYY